MEANLVVSAIHVASAVVASGAHAASAMTSGVVVLSTHAASAVASTTPSATGADGAFYCLGVRALGRCQYNPLKPNNSYLTLGDALAALALIIAFLQFGTPTVKLRSRIRAKLLKFAFGLFVPVLVCAAYAALIPSLYSTTPTTPFGYPIVFEIAGALFGVTAFGTIAFSYFWPTKFSRRNAPEFAQACLFTLATGASDTLRALSYEVAVNAGPLVAAASAAAVPGNREPEEYQVTALQLLQILSDRRFCEVVVGSSPGTVIAVVEELKSHNADRTVASALLRELSTQAFVRDDSILAKENDYVGLGHFRMYTRAIYGDYAFVARRFELFDGWKWHRQDSSVSRASTERYARAFKVAFEGYLEHKDFHTHPTVLYNAFEQLWHVFRDQIAQLRGVPEDNLYRKEEYQIASKVADVYSAVFDRIVNHQHILPTDYEESSKGPMGDPSVYALYAKAFFELIQAAAVDRGHDETLRLLLDDGYARICGRFGGDSTAAQEIQKRVLTLLTEKLWQNLVEGFYPMVTRPLCYLVGIWDSAEVPDDDSRIGFLTKPFHEALRSHFWGAYLADADKAMELLADYITFDSEKGELVQTSPYGHKSTLKLVHPGEPAADLVERFARIKRVR